METIDGTYVTTALALGAFIIPWATSFLKDIGKTWPTQWKKVAAISLSFVAALVQFGTAENWTSLDWNAIVVNFAVIWSMSQIAYKGFWKDTNLDTGLTKTFAKPEDFHDTIVKPYDTAVYSEENYPDPS